MNDILFENIFEKLKDFLPENWQKVIFRVCYFGESYNMKFYVDLGDKKYRDCFDTLIFGNVPLIGLFMDVNEIIAPIRNGLQDTEKWTVMTMSMDLHGNKKMEFECADIKEDFTSYEEKWKKRYLTKRGNEHG